jgi:hypothetical protein
MYQRSYSLGLNPGDAERLHTFFESKGVGNNANISMVDAANNIGSCVGLSHTPTGTVAIPHGWETQRLMFVLVVDEILNNASSQTHYIQGYSEYYDPSLQGSLDPNSDYFINSITTVARTVNPYTNQVDSRIISTLNIVFDPTGNISYNQVTDPNACMELVRPMDVMTHLYSNSLYNDMNGVNLNVKTTSISNGANVSSRANNDPLKYFTNTVNAVIAGKCVTAGYNNPETVLSNANGMVTEPALTNNGFIYQLARLTGNLEPGSFTLNTLNSMCPGVNERITLVRSGGLMRDPTQLSIDTECTESMLNYTEQSGIAQLFINSLTANMSENLISVISGTITNITGMMITTIASINSFLEGVDITPYGNRIINYVNAVIAPQITVNNLRLVSIVFECDLLGDSTVSVSVDNGAPITYRVPTFADSLYTPVLTDTVTKNAVISDFETVVDTVMSMAPNNTTGVYDGY